MTPSEWPTTPVRESMLPLEQTLVLSPDGELGAAAMELVQDGSGRGLVLDGPRLAGLISVISRLLELSRLRESQGLGGAHGEQEDAAGSVVRHPRRGRSTDDPRAAAP